MKVVFMGTPDFALPVLQRLLDDGHEVAAVYCQPDRPQGRHFTLTPPPVKTLALQRGLTVLQPESFAGQATRDTLAALAPEVVVVAAYGKLLPQAVLDIPPLGCLNVHGSLLPRYRGAAPIQRAVMHGEKTTGVTIMRMAAGLDAGDMLLTRETEIGPRETAGELFDRLADLGAQALCDALRQLDTLRPVPQDDALATWASPLKKTDGAIDWRRPAAALDAQIRGVTPWPGAYTFLDGKRLKIHEAQPVPGNGAPGLLLDAQQAVVACGEGALALLQVQPEGARRMSGAEFLRGRRLAPGAQFTTEQ